MIGPTNLASSEFQKVISVLADQTSTQKSLFTLSSRADSPAVELLLTTLPSDPKDLE